MLQNKGEQCITKNNLTIALDQWLTL